MGNGHATESTRATSTTGGSHAASTTASKPKAGKLLGWDIQIVPDDYKGTLPKANWIYERYRVEYEALYKKVEGGTTNLKILEGTGTGHGHAVDTQFPGFRSKILKAIKRLMTTRTGRKLIKQIASGGQDVTMRPSNVKLASTTRGSTANATNGTGTSSTIYLDPNLSNKSVTVLDKHGNPLATPFFLVLGHELIHARHNQLGTNARGTANADYGNDEEKNTIESRTGLTENALRKEHGLGVRHGHGGADTGVRGATVSGGAAGG